jgi:hypothetical protein
MVSADDSEQRTAHWRGETLLTTYPLWLAGRRGARIIRREPESKGKTAGLLKQRYNASSSWVALGEAVVNRRSWLRGPGLPKSCGQACIEGDLGSMCLVRALLWRGVLKKRKRERKRIEKEGEADLVVGARAGGETLAVPGGGEDWDGAPAA